MIETPLVIFFMLIIVILIDKIINKNKNNKYIENFLETTEEPNKLFKVTRPFVNVYDNFGNQLNVTLLSRPFYAASHYEDYKKIKDKFLVLGISSYQEFPNEPKNPKDGYSNSNQYNYIKWVNMCEGWLHCFRDPDEFLPKQMNKILLSESDFTDCNINKPDTTVEKKYDFIYICHRDDLNDCSTNEWVAFNKNLSLAEKCFSILCKKKKYKGLLVGRGGCKLPEGCDEYIDTTNKLDYWTMIKKYDEAKFIFLPNLSDASPRVLTEALCHNIPCLVNEKLVGGWKYVTPETGEFFTDENDFEFKLEKIINNLNNYKPREYFVKNYGIINAGVKFKNFVYDIFGDRINIPKEKVTYLTMEFEKKDYKKCEY